MLELITSGNFKNLENFEISSLLGKYQNSPDPIVSGITSQICENKIAKSAPNLETFFAHNVTLESLPKFQNAILKFNTSRGDAVVGYILEQLEISKEIIKGPETGSQKDSWKIFKHLATLLGHAPDLGQSYKKCEKSFGKN